MKKNVKILHVIEQLGFGGAAHGTLALIKYSKLKGNFQHSILSLLPPENNKVEEVTSQGIEVLFFLDKKQRDSHLKMTDIVQVEWWNNPAINDFVCSALPPIRLIMWIRVNCFSSAHYLSNSFIGRADHIMLTAKRSYELDIIKSLSYEIKEKKISILFAGADFEDLHPCFNKKKDDSFIIGYIGTVEFIKMHRNYISMCSSINIPNIKFVVCGEGIIDILKEQANKFGSKDKFEFLGYVQDRGAQLEKFEVFGYPLNEETYATSEKSLQEAMYMGVPPVVFPYGGLDYLVQDSQTGIVVKTEEEYKEAIEFLYHNPDFRKKLGKAANEYANNNFGAHNQTKKLHEIYNKVVNLPKKDRPEISFSQSLILGEKDSLRGTNQFLLSLQPIESKIFENILNKEYLIEVFYNEIKITKLSEQLLFVLKKYYYYYPTDCYLSLWMGIVYLNTLNYEKALTCFNSSLNNGLTHWRVQIYAAISAYILGKAWKKYFKTIPTYIINEIKMEQLSLCSFTEVINFFIETSKNESNFNKNIKIY